MELPTPIAVYWDLAVESADEVELLRIAGEVLATKPLLLHLYDGASGFRGETAALLSRLKGSPIAVSLTIDPAGLEEGRAFLSAAGLKEVLVSVNGSSEIPQPLVPATGISYWLSSDNWRQLPAAISICRDRGIRRVVLPMQRLYNGESPFFLTAAEQKELTALLIEAGGHSGIELTIHDPFLWKAFNPGVPFPQGGCQAANTMIAIAPNGSVYSCPSLPVPLGLLGECSLREIVTSAEKKAFRRMLLENPAGCRDCGEAATCKGGCRGRGYVHHGNLDGIDKACR